MIVGWSLFGQLFTPQLYIIPYQQSETDYHKGIENDIAGFHVSLKEQPAEVNAAYHVDEHPNQSCGE